MKKKNVSHLCKFEPEKPNSFGEILFEKFQYLQRMYELINGFATQQFRSFKSLFPFVIDYKEPKLAQSAQIDQLFQLLNLIITNYLCIRQRPLCWDILYANEQKFKQWHQQGFAYTWNIHNVVTLIHSYQPLSRKWARNPPEQQMPYI